MRAILGPVLLLAIFASSLNAGGVTTAKIDRRESLRVTYTPDPNETIVMSEILVTVAPVAGLPCAADRDLEIIYYSGPMYGGNAVAYSTKVFLPEGATSATVRLNVTNMLGYGMWVFDVHEDGQSIVRPRAPAMNTSYNNQTRKTTLEVTFDSTPASRLGGSTATLNSSTTNNMLISQAPISWQGYLGYELVIISARSLEITSTEQAKALSDYVLAGGYLLVHQADSKTPLLVDRLFSQDQQLAEADSRWEIVDRNSGSTRHHGGGVVAAYENLPSSWQDLVKATSQYPMGELSLASSADQNWFWKNLVLSVGRTPIWSFVAFVTVFVIVIGPVMIRFTDKLRQRTLLLVLVPAFSLVATLLFLVFNVSKDGFSTRGRVAAVQYYDTTTGQGFSWSRQSYFSGAPPRDGLKFPALSFIRLREEEFNRNNWRDPRERVIGTIEQGPEEVALKNWINPRSQQSLLVGSPVQATAFPITAQTVNDETVSIKNETDQPLPIVVLKKSAELYFCALDLAAGETRVVVAQSSGKVDSETREPRIDLEPKPPLEIDGAFISSGRYYNYSSVSSSDPIDNMLKRSSVANLPNYSYWIISQQLPSHPLPFAKEVYKKEQHFLIMTGAYKW